MAETDVIQNVEDRDNMDILDVKEAAQYLKCSTSKIYGQVKRGIIPFVRNEGNIIFRKLDLFRWLGTMRKGFLFGDENGLQEAV
jgi:excisionase family DNA binding protein